MLNLGDVAMLQVCVRRLLGRWPRARIDVLTTAPGELARHCPEAHPLAAEGRYGWLAGDAGGARATLARVAGRLPGATWVRAESAVRGLGPEVGAYLSALARADLFAMSGRGGMTDAFADEAAATLGELETAARLGVPAALLSQGIGPLDDPALRRHAARVLPGVNLIAVREARLAGRLLRELGVPDGGVAVAGDDAAELAWSARPPEPATTGIGLSMRLSPSSRADAAVEPVGAAVRAAARRLDSGVTGVPISLYPGQDDAVLIGRMVDSPPSGVDTPAAAIAAAGSCRIVVSGTYHAALFAAAQGVPVVALAGSPYYDGKLSGLRDYFGSGVTLVRMDEPALARRLGEAIEFAWATPVEERARMLSAAERQVAAGREAYGRLAGLMGPSPTTPAAVS